VPIMILCPKCSAKYNLRQDRVSLGIKRARCFCCQTEFDIESAVLELLGVAPGLVSPPVPTPAVIATEPIAPPPATESMSEYAGIEPKTLDQEPVGEAIDAAASGSTDNEQEFQASGPEVAALDDSGQPPPLDLPEPTDGHPDLDVEFPPISQPASPSAAVASDTPPIQETTGVLPGMVAIGATGDYAVEIESSDLVFDTEENLSTDGGDSAVTSGGAGMDLDAPTTSTLDEISPEKDMADTQLEAVNADQQSDSDAVPLEDAEAQPATGGADTDATENLEKPQAPDQIGLEPFELEIEEDVFSGLPATPENPDETSGTPLPALGQDTETLDPQGALPPSPLGGDEAEPLVKASASEQSETGIIPKTENVEFDIRDLLDPTVSMVNDEAADTIPTSPSEAEPEAPATPQMEQQSDALASADDTVEPSPQEIPADSKPEELGAENLPDIDLGGESLPDLTLGSTENATMSEQGDSTELSAGDTVAVLGKMPELEPPKPQAEPTPNVTNEAAKIKIRIGDDLIENLTIEEVAAMVEDRRLLENHYIARQFSENWILASLVPALRPVFEKVRSEKVRFEAPPPPTAQGGKRGLFNGLFGRN